MMHELAMNLKLPVSTNATQQFIDFVYLTQVSESVFKLIKSKLLQEHTQHSRLVAIDFSHF